MDPNLRVHFDQAVSDDPGADPGAMARAAIVQGGRVRRRRKQLAAAGLAAAAVLALGVPAAVTLRSGPTGSAHPPTTIAAAMMPVAAPFCSPKPVTTRATDVAVFMHLDVTDRQRTALEAALKDDARVGALSFENRAQAFEKFQVLWADSPDFVAAVGPENLPESFRLRLVDASQYVSFHADYAAMSGVQDVLGRICPGSAPIGGMQ